MTPSITVLRALAEAATPGVWRAETTYSAADDRETSIVLIGFDEPTYDAPGMAIVNEHENAEHDAAFIAACAPQTILALLDRLDQQERLLEKRYEDAIPDAMVVVLNEYIAKIDAVRALAENWRGRHDTAVGDELRRRCADDLEAALGGRAKTGEREP